MNEPWKDLSLIRGNKYRLTYIRTGSQTSEPDFRRVLENNAGRGYSLGTIRVMQPTNEATPRAPVQVDLTMWKDADAVSVVTPTVFADTAVYRLSNVVHVDQGEPDPRNGELRTHGAGELVKDAGKKIVETVVDGAKAVGKGAGELLNTGADSAQAILGAPQKIFSTPGLIVVFVVAAAGVFFYFGGTIAKRG